MFQNLDRATLLELAGFEGYPAISIFMPTHRAGAEKQQDPVRMKNLVAEAEHQLVSAGMRAPEAQAVLGEAARLPQDPTFWRDTCDGLAVFVEPGSLRTFKLCTPMPEQVIVGPWFYLRPLMPAFSLARPFFVLAFSQASARLFRADLTGIEQLELPEGTPTSLAEELRFDLHEETLQYKAVRNAGPGQGVAIAYHGHGGEKDVRLENLKRYVEHLDKGVVQVLDESREAPLIVAGVDYEVDLYGQANTYPRLVTDARISGNPDDLSPERIHALAIHALKPTLDAPVRRDLEELSEKAGGELVSHDIARIVPAATQGRIKALLLSDGVGPLGRVNIENWTVEQTSPGQPRYLREAMDAMGGQTPSDTEWDLVDIAISETLTHHGDVFAFTGEDPPVAGAAALYRY